MHIEQSSNHKSIRLLASLAAIAVAFTALPATAATLERIKETGHIKLGYMNDARPFSFQSGGAPDGYSIALCNKVVAEVKKKLGLSQLAVDWVAVPAEGRVKEVQSGAIDLLCAPMVSTLGRRQEVSFSIPVFASGLRAVLRSDASPMLKDALGETPSSRVVWRGTPAAKTLSATTVAVVQGTTSESWLKSRVASLELGAKVTTVPDYKTGLQQLRDRKIDIFFGDRTIVLGQIDAASAKDYLVYDRIFTREPAALALQRGDEDFRSVVDGALSQLYASGEFKDLYTKWFEEFTYDTRTFFAWNTVEP
jgi:polar amino acid transport system substrate-binding protein